MKLRKATVAMAYRVGNPTKHILNNNYDFILIQNVTLKLALSNLLPIHHPRSIGKRDSMAYTRRFHI